MLGKCNQLFTKVSTDYNYLVRLLMDEKDTDDVPDFNDLFREDDEEDTGGRSLEELERRDERRKWEERRKEILLEFAEYTYYGESVSYIFFKLAWKMSLDSNELLWLAIIGIFDLYVNDRITKKTFDDYVSQLKNHLKRLANSKSTVNLFDQANTSIDDILNVPAGRRAFVSIAHKKDLKITLYRHWNLYDSLQHTKLVSCRFKVWQRTGRCRFKEFLADLGIPLRQSKQKFASMDFELRKNIFDWIENLSEKYNLQGIIADSFEANHGYRHKFAAADIVYSLNALLESPSKELSPKENFMKTLDALSWSNVDYLLEGIEQSKQQLTAILNQVHDLIELRSIQSRGPYLFAQISRSHPEARIFCNPGCLHSLARFLLPAFVASQKKKSLKSLPLVVAVEEVDDPDASLAVGIPPVAGDPTRNLFSRLFVQTASELRIEVLPVLYDYNIIKVRSEHLGDILDRLVTSFSG